MQDLKNILQQKFPNNIQAPHNNLFKISCNEVPELTIKIDEYGIFRAIVNIDGTIYKFGYPLLDNGIYKFQNFQSKPSQYSHLYIQSDGNVYLISKNVRVKQLIINGETCGWAPVTNSKNNSAAKAPEIPKELPIEEAILKILRDSSYQVKVNEHNIILSHNNSSILSITTDEQPKLTLIPENNLELIFKELQKGCYIFKNDETDIEIHICTSGKIIFQQNGPNIKETFTPQNISELLKIQLFYFKFTDIYDLLYKRFVTNGNWNNKIIFTDEKNSGNVNRLFVVFKNKEGSTILEFYIKYNPNSKKYDDFFVYNSIRYNFNIQNNEYVSEELRGIKYTINTQNKKIIKQENNQIFELKWSQANNYLWDIINENNSQLQQQQQQQQQPRRSNNSVLYNNILKSIEIQQKSLNNIQKKLLEWIVKVRTEIENKYLTKEIELINNKNNPGMYLLSFYSKNEEIIRIIYNQKIKNFEIEVIYIPKKSINFFGEFQIDSSQQLYANLKLFSNNNADNIEGESYTVFLNFEDIKTNPITMEITKNKNKQTFNLTFNQRIGYSFTPSKS